MFTQDFMNKTEDKKQEISVLDELFIASRHYRTSEEYLELLNFIGRFRRYAPYNCMLLHIQKPTLTHVATVGDWKRGFGRYPKRNARPLVILQPFGPVMFLFDLEDTEGAPVPESLIKPFKTQGLLPKYKFDNTIFNCLVHGIDVREDLTGLFEAGKAIRLNHNSRRKYQDLNLSPYSNYLILLNMNHSVEEQYSTLVHELGHIFCGHLGVDQLAWWESRIKLSKDIIEVEAESIAYLVCCRQQLKASSERYLSNYRTPVSIEMPYFSLNSILQATDYIEKMGEKKWKKPMKKARKENK